MNLQKCIRDAGYTQIKLASQLGVTQQLISKWVKNKCSPEPDMLLKLARALNIDIETALNFFKRKGNSYSNDFDGE